MDISSYIIETLPGRLEEVEAALGGLPGVELHGKDNYRLIVSIEAPTLDCAYATATSVSKLGGVAATNLVYHNFAELQL